MQLERVLLVDSAAADGLSLGAALRQQGFELVLAQSAERALAVLARGAFDVVLTDDHARDAEGVELLDRLRRDHPRILPIVLLAGGAPDAVIDAIRRGAYDVVARPFEPDDVALLLRKIAARERVARDCASPRGGAEVEPSGVTQMVGCAAPMRAMLRTVHKLAAHKTTVLVHGESGTGKELVARAIHAQSPRARGPFVPVNCGAIPAELLESELFGHVKGAFTDASRDKRGLIAEADSGTLFLDEVGELPLELQVKLLRVLQEEEIRRVGDTQELKVDIRVVAATVRELGREVAAGRFREDLYYRLNVLPVLVPPLRERMEDLPILVEHFIMRANRRLGRAVTGVGPDAMALLMEHTWPGNIRELENTVEHALVLADSQLIQAENLPPKIRDSKDRIRLTLLSGELSIKKTARVIEEELIRRALRQTGGNRTGAAKLLEISPRSLLYKIKDYGIADP